MANAQPLRKYVPTCIDLLHGFSGYSNTSHVLVNLRSMFAYLYSSARGFLGLILGHRTTSQWHSIRCSVPARGLGACGCNYYAYGYMHTFMADDSRWCSESHLTSQANVVARHSLTTPSCLSPSPPCLAAVKSTLEMRTFKERRKLSLDCVTLTVSCQ